MSAEIVPIRKVTSKRPPTLNELVERVRELARDSDNIEFDHPHFQKRLRERGRTMRQVLDTIRNGAGVSEPKFDQHGDWRIKLKRLVAGQRLQVVVVVKQETIVVVTVI